MPPPDLPYTTNHEERAWLGSVSEAVRSTRHQARGESFPPETFQRACELRSIAHTNAASHLAPVHQLASPPSGIGRILFSVAPQALGLIDCPSCCSRRELRFFGCPWACLLSKRQVPSASPTLSLQARPTNQQPASTQSRLATCYSSSVFFRLGYLLLSCFH